MKPLEQYEIDWDIDFGNWDIDFGWYNQNYTPTKNHTIAESKTTKTDTNETTKKI